MPNNRKGVCCDICMKWRCQSRTYKCLICYDMDLCSECYDSKRSSGFHSNEHPCQCILSSDFNAIYYGGEEVTGKPQSYTCPMCGEMGFTNHTLQQHMSERHNAAGYENVELNTTRGLWLSTIPRLFVCPICVALQACFASQMHHDLCHHLLTEHAVSNTVELGVDSEYTTESTSSTNCSDSDTDDTSTENDENIPIVYSRDDTDLLLPEKVLQQLNILNPDPNSLLDIHHASRSRLSSRMRRTAENARCVSQRPHSVTRRLREAARTLQDQVLERQREIQQQQREVTCIQLEKLEQRYASAIPEDSTSPTHHHQLEYPILPSPPDEQPSSSISAFELTLLQKNKAFNITDLHFLLDCGYPPNGANKDETIWKKQQRFLQDILMSAAECPKKVQLDELIPSAKYLRQLRTPRWNDERRATMQEVCSRLKKNEQ